MKVDNCVFGILLLGALQQYAASDCTPPCLYVTNISSVFRLPLNSTNGLLTRNNRPEVLFQSTGHIRSIDIDPKNDHIYWGDFKYNTINRSSLNGSSRISLFTYAIGYPQGLAVDWTSNILYWTDNLMKLIELSDTNGRHRKVLFKLFGDDEPRGLVVNPVEGYLFWTDWGSRARIERSTLSGKNRKTIVSNSLKWPNDLAIDYNSNRLYWVDAYMDRIESVNFNGDERRLNFALQSSSIHPYGMAFDINKNIAYLTDWYRDAVVAIGDNIKGTHVLYENPKKQKSIGQVRMYNNMLPEAYTPCLRNTNRCSHLCLKEGQDSSVCDCPTGMALKNSKIQCEEVEKEYEVFFADSHSISVYHLIKYVDQDGFSIRPLDIPSHVPLGYPIALDYDPIGNMVYWTDRKTNKTYRMSSYSTRPETILDDKYKGSFGIAIDKTSRVLYWFGDDGKSIKMSTLDGKHTKTILTHSLQNPRDIVIHEEKGYIYFTDYTLQHIGRINRDGTGLKLYRGTKPSIYATGLAIDKIENRLYWCDVEHYSIESTDLDFNNRRKIIQKTIYAKRRFWLLENYGHVIAPFSIAILGEKIFWSELYKEAIFVADKRSGTNIEYVTGGLDHPRDIHVFKDQASTEYRKIYTFSFVKQFSGQNQAYCFKSNQCQSPFSSRNYIPNPRPCPTGYKESRIATTCSNCSDAFGANFKCPCADWKTCAQRAYADVLGCHMSNPYMAFKVRECIQVVKPGYCPYQNTFKCDTLAKTCDSDDGCDVSSKCCQSLCGKKCTKSLPKKYHPCTENSVCSHFCIAKENEFECACPDEMSLNNDGKTCLPKNATYATDICSLPSDQGACHPYLYEKRWYFNEKTKKCEIFKYGGCKGNENNFFTKIHCEHRCTGSCPVSSAMSTCDIKENSCLNDLACKGKQLCCDGGCGKLCKEPVNQPVLDKCYQPVTTRHCFGQNKNWYYNFKDKTCKQFTDHECSENENSFPDEVTCYKACVNVLCRLPKLIGDCRGAIMRYYFNEATEQCEEFSYGGCGGNENNFNDKKTCVNYCINDEPDACYYKPCQNAESCTPIGRYGSDYKCTCKTDWIGKSCYLNVGPGKVHARFANIPPHIPITVGLFQQMLASVFTIFCTFQIGGKCEFETSESVKKERVRRLSIAYPIDYKFSPQDIQISEYHDNQKIISFNLYIKKPLQYGDTNAGYMTPQSIEDGFKRLGSSMAQELGLTYLGLKTPQVTEQTSTKKSTTQKSLLAVTVVLVLLIIVLVAVYYAWKRYYKRKAISENTPSIDENGNEAARDGVQWTFENQLYDDLYPQTVTLPTYKESEKEQQNISETQPPPPPQPLGATGGTLEAQPEITGSKDWVQFEDESKIPITDFVEANLSDIDDILNEPPPDYTSQIGTPSIQRSHLPNPFNSHVDLSEDFDNLPPHYNDTTNGSDDMNIPRYYNDTTNGSDDMHIPDISTDELLTSNTKTVNIPKNNEPV